MKFSRAKLSQKDGRTHCLYDRSNLQSQHLICKYRDNIGLAACGATILYYNYITFPTQYNDVSYRREVKKK